MDAERLVEAMIFASADPVPTAAVARALPERWMRSRCWRRCRRAMPGGGWSWWRSRADGSSAPRRTWRRPLTRVVQQPRRLPRAAMEALAVIAYHQPTTRAEVEAIRGASLAQATMDALLEAGLVEPKGRKEAPGRPTLWGTTPGFLAQFGLKSIRELPRREDLLTELPAPSRDVT